ncbi:MAG: MBL fold metallo-hydrolase [Ferruginibacter sp.]
MCLSITSLNSGSNGNCYYIGNDHEAVLVDAGLACRETEKRMNQLGLSMKKVKAIFISHEHTDHIKGLPVIAEKYSLPVYITNATSTMGGIRIKPALLYSFTAYEPIQIGDITVTAFPKYHDAADPHSFIISCNEVNIGVFTDIGAPCQQLIKYFSLCHAAFLEANYDEAMLENGRYPHFLKNRIRNGQGHLSNKQALEVFTKYRPSFMSHLFLSHLSQHNNCPKLAHKLFYDQAKGTEIIIASRYEQTAIYNIEKSAINIEMPSITNTPKLRPITSLRPVQLSLFQ